MVLLISYSKDQAKQEEIAKVTSSVFESIKLIELQITLIASLRVDRSSQCFMKHHWGDWQPMLGAESTEYKLSENRFSTFFSSQRYRFLTRSAPQ